MAFCRYCGFEVEENDKFCPACGKPTHEDGYSSAKQSAEEKFKEINDTADFTENYSDQDINDNKIIALFAYLGILILVPIFGAKESKFAHFHVSQGVNLIITAVVYTVATGVLSLIFQFIPVVCTIVDIVCALVGLVIFVLIIMGIYNAVNGKAKELPLVGNWKIIDR